MEDSKVILIIITVFLGLCIVLLVNNFFFDLIALIENKMGGKIRNKTNCIRKMLGIKPKDKYDGFDIEYMPNTGRYFPRYKGKYMRFDGVTQLFISLYGKELLCICDQSKTEEGAQACIDRYIEQMITKNKIIKYKPENNDVDE